MFAIQFANWGRIRTEEYLSSFDTNPNHPFFGYLGNRAAVETAVDIAFQAFQQRSDDGSGQQVNFRLCRERIALYAPMSAGKTEFARRFSRMLRLPFAECDGTSLASVAHFVESVLAAWKNNSLVQENQLTEIPSETLPSGLEKIQIPPMVIFIDEVHRMSRKLQDSFLKLTEINDGRVIVNNKEYDFRNTCIIVATTEPGKVVRPIKSRFTPIHLERPSLEIVAKIILSNHPDWSMDVCRSVSALCPVTREALAFAKRVTAAEARLRLPLAEVVEEVRRRLGIYRIGLTSRAVQVLKVLSFTPNGLSRSAMLSACDNMEEEEFVSEILPQFQGNEKRPALVVVESRHKITQAGLDVLKQCEEERDEPVLLEVAN